MSRHRRFLLHVLCSVGLATAVYAAPAADRGPGREVEYVGSEGAMPARLYVPPADGRRPAVLVLHTAAGPGPNVEAFAAELASAGFVAMTPDLFSLHEFGAAGRTDHPLVLGDARGALAWLRAHPRVDPARVGVVGFSFGGRVAIVLAATVPEQVRALVVYYAVADHAAPGRGLGGAAAKAEPLAARVASIRAPVLIHHGDADRQVPVAQGRILHSALLAAGKPSSLHIYAGADHLFNFSIGPDVQHHPEAARLSRERTLDFLARQLAHDPSSR